MPFGKVEKLVLDKCHYITAENRKITPRSPPTSYEQDTFTTN